MPRITLRGKPIKTRSNDSKRTKRTKRTRSVRRKTLRTITPFTINSREKKSLNQIAENEMPLCCMCEEPTDYISSLIPRACPYGSDRQHRICNICWWSGKHGKIAFASENASHQCPGCVKNLPLSNWKTSANQNKNQPVDIIDLE